MVIQLKVSFFYALLADYNFRDYLNVSSYYIVSAALRSLDEALAAAEDTDDEDDNDDILPEPSFVFGDLQTDQIEAGQETDHSSNSSGSLFSSRSWQDKVVRGELTAMVRDKSRSVQDLMVLTAVEPMSDIEFLSFNQLSKPDQQENVSQPIAPQISVTSPSFTVRSAMMESDVPLLENDSKYKYLLFFI